VSVNAALNTTTSTRSVLSTIRTPNASLTAAVDASVLTYGFRGAQLTCTANNSVTSSSVTMPTQRATATFHLQLAGNNVWDRSVTSTGDLGGIPRQPTTCSRRTSPRRWALVRSRSVSVGRGRDAGRGRAGDLADDDPGVRLVLNGGIPPVALDSGARDPRYP
jgi:hypothetical protein